MNTQKIKTCFLVFFLIFLFYQQKVLAQPEIKPAEASQFAEKTVLFTDREIYAVNEDILFSSWNCSKPDIKHADWSNVLYVELVSPEGEAFVSKKFSFDENGASGSVRIPSTVLTGNYYLRAYTRWMRDYSPYGYAYKMVSIVNPFRPELLEPSGNTVIQYENIRTPIVNSSEISVKTDKTTYSRGDQVSVKIISKTASSGDNIVVSVIPEATELSLQPDLIGLQSTAFFPAFIPETRGLSVSGKVINLADSLPIPFSLVGLTIFKANAENQNILTNEKGQFFFDLSELKGEYEIFISAKPSDDKVPVILVDNDFTSLKLELPYVSFDLSAESMKKYQKIAFVSQIQSLYRQQESEEILKSFSSDSAFYGAPDFVLKLTDFIPLPSVKDYFYELIPQVGVRRENKKSVLKVLGTYSELGIYEPLVLVDMVPVFDVEKVLELQPERIERIEVVTTPYIRGDIIFGGIVSLFSKKGDLAGIDLPAAGRFITYNMLSSDENQPMPVLNQRVPDLRNCLYWNPGLTLNGTNPGKVTFDAGNNAGNYLIVVRQVDQNGNIQVATSELKIE